MRRQSVLVVLAGLSLVWAASRAAAQDVITVRGYLNTLTSAVGIDSVKFLYAAQFPLAFPTPGWGGTPGELDSADFAVPTWPDDGITIYPTINGNPKTPKTISPVVPDSWYVLQVGGDSGYVKFVHRAGVEESRANQVPGFGLGMPDPNPFAHSTAISFALPIDEQIGLSIISPTGARIRTLVSGHCPAGCHVRTWDATDARNRRVEPGVYFCRLATGSAVLMRKLVLLE